MIIGSILVFTLDFSTYDPSYDFSTADGFLVAGAIIYMIGLIGSIITFSMFSFRAMKNLHIWGSRKAEMSPGWTVGWYFIPFANLWKPLQAMNQIWDGTEELSSEKTIRYPNIGSWWGLWIVTNISANISFRMSLADPLTESAFKTGAMLDILSSVTGILAVLIIIPILKRIFEMQESTIKGGVFD